MIIAYTDGACTGNGTINSRSAFSIHFPNFQSYDICSLTPDTILGNKTSNQRAELFGILYAVKITSPKDICVYSDNKYAINCYTQWFPKWISNGITNKENMDIIGSIYQYVSGDRIVSIEYVPGHTGVDGNEVADTLAKYALENNIIHPFLEKYIKKNV